MKKIMLLVVLFTLPFVMSMNVYAYNSNVNTSEEYKQKQIEQSSKMSRFNELYSKEKDNPLFQDSFGGVFFDDTDLYINVVINLKDEFVQNFNIDEDFKINYVNYSLQSLKSTEMVVMENSVELELRRTYVDEVNNVVVISSTMCYDKLISLLDDIIDVDMVSIQTVISDIDYKVKYTVNGHPYAIGPCDCTVGFAARNSSGEPGFVSAGHCVENCNSGIGSNVYYDGMQAGDVEDWKFEDGTVDAVFVKLRDPWIGTTWLPSYDLYFGGSYTGLGAPSSYYAVGTYVTFHGTFYEDDACNIAPESGYITISSINVYNQYYQIIYTNMMATSIITHEGDSGGPLTTWVVVVGGTTYNMVLGVLSFEYYGYSHFSKSSDIIDELDITAY